jgi:hypothetical protein
MADRVLFVSWGRAVPGREAHSIDVFNEAVGFYGRALEGRNIESFDVVLLAPNADLGGYMQIGGSAAQLNALREDPEYLRVMTDAEMVVDKLRATEGYAGNGVAQMMGIYQEAIEKLPVS